MLSPESAVSIIRTAVLQGPTNTVLLVQGTAWKGTACAQAPLTGPVAQ